VSNIFYPILGFPSFIPFFVGGVVAGAIFVLAITIVVFLYLRRRLYSTISREHPINVLEDDEDGDDSYHDLPHYYRPEPFLYPSPTVDGAFEADSTQEHLLSPSMMDAGHLQTPITAATVAARKSAVPPQLRPVNIIQHDDAGPSEDSASHVESETIELPPAYSNIRKKPRSPLTTPDTA
jgi:hypothetical protein